MVVSLLGALEFDSAFARPTDLFILLPARVGFGGGDCAGDVLASSVPSTVLARFFAVTVSALLRFLPCGEGERANILGDEGGDDSPFSLGSFPFMNIRSS
jgi:hypothetical protein